MLNDTTFLQSNSSPEPTQGSVDESPKAITRQFQPRQVVSAWIIIGLITLFFAGMYLFPEEQKRQDLTWISLRDMITTNAVANISQVLDLSEGSMYLEGETKGTPPQAFRVLLPPGENEAILSFLREKNMPCPVIQKKPLLGSFAKEILLSLLIIGAIGFFFLRQIKNANSSAMNFGKSRARVLTRDKKKLTFGDVAGIKEAKEEVQEIIEFLKAPDKFKKLGGKIPKGVLLLGPPGTGKTLLAKAIAGEADVPFFSISGSDFVEMFVGVGASRVRDMFEQGKKHAPCLIFIDEIDAVGQKRSTGGVSNGHDEREQTLNALLVEMDGFEHNEGVIIIAATNRPEVLDPALTRPGRFDRQIVIDLPTLEGRKEILAMHAKKIKLADDVNLSRVARGTPGFSGADLANLLNEAALLAARYNKPAVGQAEMEEARDKVLWGRERRSAALDKKEQTITAWHEAGHALLQLLCEHTDPLHKVTIIPRGRALGATMSLPNHDVHNKTRKEFLDMLVMCMGGRIAESMHVGDFSTGASMDIQTATRIARNMVCCYGMSDTFGFQSFSEPSPFLMDESLPAHSEATAQAIDAEVKRLLTEAYERATQLLTDNRDKLETLATALLEKETMDGREIEDLLGIFKEDRSKDAADVTPAKADPSDATPEGVSTAEDAAAPVDDAQESKDTQDAAQQP